MIIVGIDPGITGAVAACTPNGSLLWVEDLPVRDAGKKSRASNEIDGGELARILRVHVADIGEAWVEEVHAMPDIGGARHGSQASFGLGDSRGVIRGVLETLGISTRRVHPRKWKRHYDLDADKEQARALAIQLYPGSVFLARKRDHGRAEAILIARYGAYQARLIDSFHGSEPRPSIELTAR